jgi:hypothetical protein
VDLRPYWPPSTSGSIIITTQRSEAAHWTSSSIWLDVFSEDEGSKFILSLTGLDGQSASEKTVSQAKQVSNELGGLPLLLSHVAGFMGSSKCSLETLLEHLQQPTSLKRIWAYDSSTSTNFQYGEPMQKVWRLALDALSDEAETTLNIIAMLNPDGIPEDLLVDDWAPDLAFLHPSRHFE